MSITGGNEVQLESQRESRAFTLLNDSLSSDEDNEQHLPYNTGVVAVQEVSSIELMARCLNQEVLIVRFWLRALGIRIRQCFDTFCNNTWNASRRHLRRMLLKYSPIEPITFEGDAAMILNQVPLQVERKPPKYTFNNIEAVLITDDDEEGVVHRNSYLFPKWSMLPIRVKTESIARDDISEFQLFNKPLSVAMTLEDDDELMSMGSTRTGVAETLQSMEAQVAMLTKQLQYFMSLRTNEKDTSPERASIVSDDEGKGGSLCSPTMGGKTLNTHSNSVIKPVIAPVVCPPGLPPPPPPPLNLLKPCNQSQHKPRLAMEHIETKDENRNTEFADGDREPIVRPSVFDLKTVRLKKTNTDRSPGGTPLPRGRRSTHIPTSDLDQGAFLGAALKAKFRTVQENISFSEQEDDNSSLWADDDS